jgi:heme-degrading monooxygenase HmoA
MIARVWSAQTTAALLPAYVEHVRARVLPALQQIEGYAGAMLLEQARPDAVEVVVITWWRSLDAIRSFAGGDLEGAVVADEAAAVLSRFDHRVRHYELLLRDDPGGE